MTHSLTVAAVSVLAEGFARQASEVVPLALRAVALPIAVSVPMRAICRRLLRRRLGHSRRRRRHSNLIPRPPFACAGAPVPVHGEAEDASGGGCCQPGHPKALVLVSGQRNLRAFIHLANTAHHLKCGAGRSERGFSESCILHAISSLQRYENRPNLSQYCARAAHELEPFLPG